MLRTRRRDTNVKPNRRDSRLTRLDRKSSRGMLYENEELRLKTININAEIERGQSDIKKLKRENDMLKKEIWCLRDEYEKLDRMLKEKKIDFSSSSTTCSESDSNSSATDSDEEETSQNLENVQKTNIENINRDFDHLSVVPEENSTENSDKTSNRNSLPNDQWNCEKDIIKPDQSYPNYRISKSDTKPMNFFSPININSTYEQEENGTLYPGDCYAASYHQNIECPKYYTENTLNTNAAHFYQNRLLLSNCNNTLPEVKNMEKSSADLLVKIDNCKFDNKNSILSNTPSQSTFSNGGNLEELLNDIETISQEILKLSNLQRSNYNGDEIRQSDIMTEIQREDFTYLQNPVMENLLAENGDKLAERPYKSELNVVLMPNSMPLIGFDKYRNIQRSFESINSKILDDMSASQQNLCVIPSEQPEPPPFPEQTPLITISPSDPIVDTNPFLFSNLKENYVNADYFNVRYNPDNFATIQEEEKELSNLDASATVTKSASRSNLLETQTASENEENLKFKTTKIDEKSVEDAKVDSAKPPSKLSIRRKVSIHFKGKKDKNKKLSLDSSAEMFKPKVVNDKKHSLFDIKFNENTKQKTVSHQKTPSAESKKSTTETSNLDGKTGSSSDSKTSNCDKKNSIVVERKDGEKKARKSVSVSPDRIKHVSVKEDGAQKRHKKHRNRDRAKNRRSTIHTLDVRNMRERSYSVCTDRSNVLESRLGMGNISPYFYDDYSDRDSITSCDTVNTQNRKMSTVSNVQFSGKVPWCGCWGNGCL